MPQDSFHASKRVCHLMKTGVAAIFGPQSSHTASHVQSICDTMEVSKVKSSSYRGLHTSPNKKSTWLRSKKLRSATKYVQLLLTLKVSFALIFFTLQTSIL